MLDTRARHDSRTSAAKLRGGGERRRAADRRAATPGSNAASRMACTREVGARHAQHDRLRRAGRRDEPRVISRRNFAEPHRPRTSATRCTSRSKTACRSRSTGSPTSASPSAPQHLCNRFVHCVHPFLQPRRYQSGCHDTLDASLHQAETRSSELDIAWNRGMRVTVALARFRRENGSRASKYPSARTSIGQVRMRAPRGNARRPLQASTRTRATRARTSTRPCTTRRARPSDCPEAAVPSFRSRAPHVDASTTEAARRFSTSRGTAPHLTLTTRRGALLRSMNQQHLYPCAGRGRRNARTRVRPGRAQHANRVLRSVGGRAHTACGMTRCRSARTTSTRSLAGAAVSAGSLSDRINARKHVSEADVRAR